MLNASSKYRCFPVEWYLLFTGLVIVSSPFILLSISCLKNSFLYDQSRRNVSVDMGYSIGHGCCSEPLNFVSKLRVEGKSS